jgi:YD repeat-containing protein
MAIDRSYPDRPPTMFVTVTASGVDGTLGFAADELELFGSDGEPLITIRGSLEPGTPTHSSDFRSPTYFAATDANRDLLAACEATSLRISVWTSQCRCETVLEGPLSVSCYPDVRAGDVLSEPGFDAPEGKPCAMTVAGTLLGDEATFEHRYRYDAEGRLRFIDTYDEGTVFTERVAFVWEPTGYLRERQTINPETGLMIMRQSYAYHADGLLSTTEVDGYSRGFIDGEIDLIGTYFLGETPWRSETSAIDSGESFVSTYSYVPNTVTTEGNTYVFDAPLESPNQFFALPEEVDYPKLLRSSPPPFEYTYAADGRLMSASGGNGLIQLRHDYSYDCP